MLHLSSTAWLYYQIIHNRKVWVGNKVDVVIATTPIVTTWTQFNWYVIHELGTDELQSGGEGGVKAWETQSISHISVAWWKLNSPGFILCAPINCDAVYCCLNGKLNLYYVMYQINTTCILHSQIIIVSSTNKNCITLLLPCGCHLVLSQLCHCIQFVAEVDMQKYCEDQCPLQCSTLQYMSMDALSSLYKLKEFIQNDILITRMCVLIKLLQP